MMIRRDDRARRRIIGFCSSIFYIVEYGVAPVSGCSTLALEQIFQHQMEVATAIQVHTAGIEMDLECRQTRNDGLFCFAGRKLSRSSGALHVVIVVYQKLKRKGTIALVDERFVENLGIFSGHDKFRALLL